MYTHASPSQLCVLVASYTRSTECVDKHGVNVSGALKPDGSALVMAVSISAFQHTAVELLGVQTTCNAPHCSSILVLLEQKLHTICANHFQGACNFCRKSRLLPVPPPPQEKIIVTYM